MYHTAQGRGEEREGQRVGEGGKEGRGELGGPGEHLGYPARCFDLLTAAPQAWEGASSRRLRLLVGSTSLTL